MWKCFVKCFLKVPLTCLGSMVAAVQPDGLQISQKIFYKTFFTTCRPRLYKFCFTCREKFTSAIPALSSSFSSSSSTAEGGALVKVCVVPSAASEAVGFVVSENCSVSITHLKILALSELVGRIFRSQKVKSGTRYSCSWYYSIDFEGN